MARTSKWVAIRTDYAAGYTLGLHNLSPAAHRLYLGSIQMQARNGWEHVSGTACALMHLGRNSRKAIRELVEAGFWIPVDDDRGLYRPAHEGAYWRTGIPPAQRQTIPLALRAEVYMRDGYACVECDATDNLTLDHIWPWSQGGPDTAENLRVLCQPCNSTKGAKLRGA